jgi:hypothetical protein
MFERDRENKGIRRDDGDGSKRNKEKNPTDNIIHLKESIFVSHCRSASSTRISSHRCVKRWIDSFACEWLFE